MSKKGPHIINLVIKNQDREETQVDLIPRDLGVSAVELEAEVDSPHSKICCVALMEDKEVEDLS